MSLSLFAVLASNGLPSAVDSVRLSLEASSAWWFSIVNYSGYAVALGCAMETPETFIIIKRWWLARFRSDVREETTEDKKSWIVPLAAVGLIFIVVGIFVETYAEGKVSDIDALLRGHESDKISAAEQDAGTAQDSAKAAATNAGIAQTSADKAQASAAQADTDAGGAQRKAQAVGKETDLLTGQLSEAKAELQSAERAEQQERRTLTDMATCLAPRIIPNNGIFNPATKTETWSTLDAVRPFSAFQAIIDVVPGDAEARRAAKNIERSLRAAGWERVTLREKDDLRDGVQVVPWNPEEIGNRGMGTPEGEARFRRNWEAYQRTGNAADAIVDWLHLFNWVVTRSGAVNPDIPLDAVQIEVGLYPAVQFVPPPGNKLFAELEAQHDRSLKEAQAQAQADLERRQDEQWKTYPPKMAAIGREMRQHEKEEMAKWDARYSSQPCRLVNPFMQ